jgi:hypothetical protein
MLERTLLNNRDDKLNNLITFCLDKDIFMSSIILDIPSNTYCVNIRSSKLFPEVFEYSDGVIIDYKDNDIIQAYIENK